MVTLEPGAAVPVLGFWLSTWPAGWVEVGSGMTLTLKPAFCSVVSAWVSCWSTTFGTGTGPAPLETYSVTTVLAGSLLPSGGLELITWFFGMVALAWLTTVDCRCAALIPASACVTDSPFTSGTAYVLPPPASRQYATPANTPITRTRPRPHGIQRRPPPPRSPRP